MRLPTPLLRNNPDVHKNTFGHALIVAGSAPMLGASALAGLAAMRMGAGMVTCAVPKSLNGVLQKKTSPVLMTLPVPDQGKGIYSAGALKTIMPALNKYQAAAIGPGMGQDPGTHKFILRFIQGFLSPLVIDADGLNALARDTRVLKLRTQATVLTPHPKEMSRLLGHPLPKGERHVNAMARRFAREHGCVLVLKGHKTCVTSPEGECYINRSGNAGMATAGSGDVLTGMITALLGQGINAWDAARVGVYCHGRAGDIAAKHIPKASLIATDLIEFIPAALKGAVRRLS